MRIAPTALVVLTLAVLTLAVAVAGFLAAVQPVQPARSAGDIAAINFWVSRCAPCRVETPDLQAAYADVQDRGVQFLGAGIKDERQLAQAFVSDVDARYPSLFDPRWASRPPSCLHHRAGSGTVTQPNLRTSARWWRSPRHRRGRRMSGFAVTFADIVTDGSLLLALAVAPLAV